MNVFYALKLIQVDHMPLNHGEVVITDPTGKPDAQMTELLDDCLSKVDIFSDLNKVDSISDLIDDLHVMTPLPYDVLSEYEKILDQKISGVNIAQRKHLVELVYQPIA